jgi:hypothetical protein
MKYKCPLCGSPLTKDHYHRIVKLQNEKAKSQKGELEAAKREAQRARATALAAKQQNQRIRAQAQARIARAQKEAEATAQRKAATQQKRLMSRIQKLEEERDMLKKHTTPQEIGLADEKVLVKRLEKEFPDDRIEHAGKGGDVLHYVRFRGKEVGLIVYECKHTDKIQGSHITQTAIAKKTRQADYAILVTTGTRKHFSGLDQASGVFIVAQSGVLTLAGICRESLIVMAKQRLDAAQKAEVAQQLMNYVTSPVCKTPLEDAISKTEKARESLEKEVKQHFRIWKERFELYQTIHYDVSHVRNNIERVLGGDKPLRLEKPKIEPLALSYQPDQ